ncbi:MAG: thioredoxin-disulfide reductase [Candidatus Omnitrophica bacterium]|nr:thioredoxin-disulfide reductase [Candidatus Omnitrophota bacterium]
MHDLIIIGAGPAGLTAGLYAGRFRLNAVILEKINPGGQIIFSPTIENYPGFPGEMSTHELIDRFEKQVEGAGVQIKIEEVTGIEPGPDLKPPVYKLKTNLGAYKTRSLIIATGAQPKRLEVEGEKKFLGRGVSYCGTCDGPMFKGKHVLVVGAGDRAIEEAIFLSRYARQVTVVHRRKQLRASKILEEKLKQEPKICFKLDTVIEKIEGSVKVESAKLKNVVTGKEEAFACDGVFIFIGIVPNTGFVKNLLQVDEAGFIITDQDLKTSAAGVFACGDCCQKGLYQVVNACGEGAVAADSAHKYLLLQK